MTALDEARAAAPWPQWKQVTCRACGREYTCTPEDDYYGYEAGPGNGTCFRCLLIEHGRDPDTTPVLVVDDTGREIDPRDNA